MTFPTLIFEVLHRVGRFFYSVPGSSKNWARIRILKQHRKILSLKLGVIGKDVAIIALFPGTSSFDSVSRLVNTLESNGYSLLIVINHNSKSELWAQTLHTESRTILIRPNIGADFGAYQAGIKLLESRRENLETVLISNDSLHYTKKSAQLLGLLIGPKSTHNCLYLNFQTVTHAGSMLMKFDSNILRNGYFWDFWDHYYCFKSKRKIIKNGEHRLSRIIFNENSSPITDSIDAHTLGRPTPEHLIQLLRWARRSDSEFFDIASALNLSDVQNWKHIFFHALSNLHVSNSLGLYLTQTQNFPLKMDLVKNGLVSKKMFLSAIESEGADFQEIQEIDDILDSHPIYAAGGLMERLKRF